MTPRRVSSPQLRREIPAAFHLEAYSSPVSTSSFDINYDTQQREELKAEERQLKEHKEIRL